MLQLDGEFYQQSYSGVAGAGLGSDSEYLDVISIEEAASLVRPVPNPFLLLSSLKLLLFFYLTAADVSIC